MSDSEEWIRQELAGLGRQPELPPIPPAVHDRILAALTAERLSAPTHDAQHQAGYEAGDAAVVPLSSARGPQPSRQSSRRWWLAAGAVAATALVATAVVTAMPGADEGAGVVADAGAAQNAAVTPLTVQPVSSGTSYSTQNLASEVPRLITIRSAAVADADSRRATFAETDDGIRSCLAGVGNPPTDLALLDLAQFQDGRVAVLAYLTGADDGTADVVVVGIRCSRTDPQVRHRTQASMTGVGAGPAEYSTP